MAGRHDQDRVNLELAQRVRRDHALDLLDAAEHHRAAVHDRVLVAYRMGLPGLHYEPRRIQDHLGCQPVRLARGVLNALSSFLRFPGRMATLQRTPGLASRRFSAP